MSKLSKGTENKEISNIDTDDEEFIIGEAPKEVVETSVLSLIAYTLSQGGEGAKTIAEMDESVLIDMMNNVDKVQVILE